MGEPENDRFTVDSIEVAMEGGLTMTVGPSWVEIRKPHKDRPHEVVYLTLYQAKMLYGAMDMMFRKD